MSADKIKEILKVLVGTLFSIAGIIGLTIGVEQELILKLIEIVFVLLGTIIGGPAAIRAALNKKLVDK